MAHKARGWSLQAGCVLSPRGQTTMSGASRTGNRRARWDLMKFPSLLVTESPNCEEINLLGKRFIFSKSKIRNLTFSSFLLELFFFSFRFLVFDSSLLTSHADHFSSFSFLPSNFQISVSFPCPVFFLCLSFPVPSIFSPHSLLTGSYFFNHVSQPWWSWSQLERILLQAHLHPLVQFPLWIEYRIK